MAPTPPTPRLPLDVHIHLFDYLNKADMCSQLELSKEIRTSALASIKTLHIIGSDDLTRCDQALVQLLKNAINLEELNVQRGIITWTQGTAIVDVLTKGLVGHRLRVLQLPWASECQTMKFFRSLGQGLLPRLTSLDLGNISWQNPSPDHCISAEIVQAMEARRDRELPPLTEIRGTTIIYAPHYDRILACCPVEALVHLEALTQSHLQVIQNHLGKHSNFLSLRSLIVSGDGIQLYNLSTTHATSLVGETLRLLVVREPAALETLEIHRCAPVSGTLAHVGGGLGRNAFTRLARLTFSHCNIHDNDFHALAEGLLATSIRLECLHFNEVWLSSPNLETFVTSLKTATGLRTLKELNLQIRGEDWGSILEELGNVPCAKTLKTLAIKSGRMLGRRSVMQFLQHLGKGRYPSLADLTLFLADVGSSFDLMAELALAISSQHYNGVTSKLRRLRLQHCSLTVDCFDELTPLFQQGALSSLVKLDVRHWGSGLTRKESSSARTAKFVNEWALLGDQIKIEHMTIVLFMTSNVRDMILAGIANPDFCPYLAGMSWIPFFRTNDVQLGLEARRRQREAYNRLST
jgi:hypothetical protein